MLQGLTAGPAALQLGGSRCAELDKRSTATGIGETIGVIDFPQSITCDGHTIYQPLLLQRWESGDKRSCKQNFDGPNKVYSGTVCRWTVSIDLNKKQNWGDLPLGVTGYDYFNIEISVSDTRGIDSAMFPNVKQELRITNDLPTWESQLRKAHEQFPRYSNGKCLVKPASKSLVTRALDRVLPHKPVIRCTGPAEPPRSQRIPSWANINGHISCHGYAFSAGWIKESFDKTRSCTAHWHNGGYSGAYEGLMCKHGLRQIDLNDIDKWPVPSETDPVDYWKWFVVDLVTKDARNADKPGKLEVVTATYRGAYIPKTGNHGWTPDAVPVSGNCKLNP